MIGDSTNAMVEGHSGSEAEVRQSLTVLIRGLRGRVAVTCFASNVARVESVAVAAHAAGRSVAIVGRSLRNLDAAARECGYLRDLPPFLTEDDVDSVPDDNLLMLVTGSQGEPRSAMARIALDTHPRVALGEGDTVVFSSRVIPGNERAIGTVQDNLVRRGVNLMTDMDHLVHVSGHPARDELRRLYRLVKPRYAVPTHGEWRHLSAHAALAQEAGAKPILLEDGDILSLAPGQAEVVDSAPVGRLVLDGNRLTPFGGGVMSARRRMLFNGVVLASLAVDANGRLRGEPRVSAPGLFDADDPELDRVGSEFADAVRICRHRFAATMRRCPMPRARRCVAHSAGACRSAHWWTCIVLSRVDELVHRPRGVCADLVDGAVRRAADRHAPGRRRGRADRLAWCARAAAPPDEGDRHDIGRRVVWFGAWLLITSPYMSFRHGWFAAPAD